MPSLQSLSMVFAGTVALCASGCSQNAGATLKKDSTAAASPKAPKHSGAGDKANGGPTKASKLTRIGQVKLPIEVHFGALDHAFSGDQLLLHSTHVSARRLTAIHTKTAKVSWTHPAGTKIDQFTSYKSLVVASYVMGGLVALDRDTGETRWELKEHSLIYGTPAAITGLSNDQLGVLGPKGAVFVDINTGKVSSAVSGTVVPKMTAMPAFKRSAAGQFSAVGVRFAAPPASVVKGQRIMSRFAVVDGATTQVYTLVVDDKARTLTLALDGSKPGTSLSWNIPSVTGSVDVFNGDPEPMKLSVSVGLLAGRLYLYEYYDGYRWSWGVGSNRLSQLKANLRGFDTQLWGQKNAKAPFKRYHFIGERLLIGAGILHQQHGAVTYGVVDPTQLTTTSKTPTMFGQKSHRILATNVGLLGFELPSKSAPVLRATFLEDKVPAPFDVKMPQRPGAFLSDPASGLVALTYEDKARDDFVVLFTSTPK